MKSPKDIFLIARIHGLKTHLLRSEDFISILKAKDIVEISDILLKSDYRTELNKIPVKDLDAKQLENIFYQTLSERLSFPLQITSGKVRAVLEDYYRKIEVENIKRIIRAIHAKEKIGEDQLIPVSRKYQTVNFSALVQTSTIREVMDLLIETPYGYVIGLAEQYEKYSNPLVLEALLDKLYYGSLWDGLNRIVDEGEVRQLIGTEIDLKNLLYLFSFKYMKIESDLVEEMIINVRYRFPRSLLPQLIGTSYEKIPRLLTWPPYAELGMKAVELIDKGMLIETEHLFSQHLYSYAETKALRKPNNLVYMFTYLYLCFREARNLTTLVTGKQLKLSEERIRSSIFL